MEHSLKEGFSGMVSGLVHIFFYPLEIVRAHLIVSEKQQRNHLPHYKNSWHAVKNIYTSQGWVGLYRGFYFTLLNSMSWSVYFFLYDVFKHRFEHKSELSKLLIATQTAFATKLFLNPFTVIKTRVILATTPEKWYKEVIEAAYKIYRVDGIKGFWSGFVPGMFLSLNGAFSLYFYQLFQHSFNTEKSSGKIMISGGLAKILSSLMFYPIFNVRIKLQQQQKIKYMNTKSNEIKSIQESEKMFYGIKDCISQTWRNGGIKGFYRGFGLTLIRLVPEYALFFLIYEKTSAYLKGKSI